MNILELLNAGGEHMIRYGGHEMAAGLDIAAENIDALREAVYGKAREVLAGGLPEKPLEIDAELPLAGMTPELMRQIDRIEPFGEGNSKPILLSSGLRLAELPRVVGADGTHLILSLRRGDAVMKGIAFGKAERVGELQMGADLQVVYTPRWNTFRGVTNLELFIHDFTASETRPQRL